MHGVMWKSTMTTYFAHAGRTGQLAWATDIATCLSTFIFISAHPIKICNHFHFLTIGKTTLYRTSDCLEQQNSESYVTGKTHPQVQALHKFGNSMKYLKRHISNNSVTLFSMRMINLHIIESVRKVAISISCNKYHSLTQIHYFFPFYADTSQSGNNGTKLSKHTS